MDEIPIGNLQPEIIPYMRNEVQLLRTANNKNIIRLIKDFEMDKNIYLVLEYCDTDVQKMVMKFQKQKLPKDLIIVILKQIVNGITFLHGQNIIHRDLKPENFAVFIDSDQIERFKQGDLSVFEQATYKLIDLGLAKKLKSQFELAQTWAGTEPFMAPEIILEKDYSFQADMYSLGVCMFQLATGRLPYMCNEPGNIEWITRQKEQARFELIDDSDLRQLIIEMLRYDPKKRISFQQLAQHKYFKIDNNQFLSEDAIILSGNLQIYQDKSEQQIPAQKFNISFQPISNGSQKCEDLQNQQIQNEIQIQQNQTMQQHESKDKGLINKIYQMRNNSQLLFRLSLQLEELSRFLKNSRYNYLTMESTLNMYAQYFRYISRQLFELLKTGFEQKRQSIRNAISQEYIINLIKEDFQQKFRLIEYKCPDNKSVGYFFKKALKQGIDPINTQTPQGLQQFDRINIECYQIILKIVQDTFYKQKQIEGDVEEKTAKCLLYICLYYLAKSRAIFKQDDQEDQDWRKEELWFDEAKQQPDMLQVRITDLLTKYGFSYE
ncbi:hypothetical protein pb186bvf_006583 [Paramecium bursaria]